MKEYKNFKESFKIYQSFNLAIIYILICLN